MKNNRNAISIVKKLGDGKYSVVSFMDTKVQGTDSSSYVERSGFVSYDQAATYADQIDFGTTFRKGIGKSVGLFNKKADKIHKKGKNFNPTEFIPPSLRW